MKKIVCGLFISFLLIGCSSAPKPNVAKGEWIELKNTVKDIGF